MALVQRLDQAFYPQFDRNWDDALFRERVLEHLAPEYTVLDLGAGAGIVPQLRFKGLAVRICGADLDPRVTENPYIDEGVVADAASLPYPDQTFDLVFSANVLEHLAAPSAVFQELVRVMKPGARALFKTPNKRHYMPLTAMATPTWFHRAYNRLRGRAGEDTFPTLYRANTPEALRQLAREAGLQVERIELIEGRPEYLRIHPLTYPAGIVYERLVNRLEALEPFRLLLMAELRCPS